MLTASKWIFVIVIIIIIIIKNALIIVILSIKSCGAHYNLKLFVILLLILYWQMLHISPFFDDFAYFTADGHLALVM